MRFNVLFPAFAALSLAACDSGAEAPAPAESETGAATPTAAATPVELPTEIPAAFQGRFGMVPDDCTSTAGDAKGLLEITGTELKFYESVGKLDAITDATAGRVRGDFSFTGEGMEWKRQEVMDLREGGNVLVRREFGENATPEAFTYTRCA